MTSLNPNHTPVALDELVGLDLRATRLEAEWVVIIDTPTAGVEQLTRALGEQIPLIQGPYDNCLYVREAGYQQFRALEGSHAGAERTLQRTPASQIEFSIPTDVDLLRKVFDTTFEAHVNEEPTVRVFPAVGSRSKLLDDSDNPNRYWNRPDSDQIHGEAIA